MTAKDEGVGYNPYLKQRGRAMLFEQKIKDRMIPIQNYATVSPDVSLKEAALSLRTTYCELEGGMCSEAGPRTVLVVDSDNKLVGIIDFNCFLKVLIPEIAGGLSGKLPGR